MGFCIQDIKTVKHDSSLQGEEDKFTLKMWYNLVGIYGSHQKSLEGAFSDSKSQSNEEAFSYLYVVTCWCYRVDSIVQIDTEETKETEP